MDRPRDKLAPVITYVIAAINAIKVQCVEEFITYQNKHINMFLAAGTAVRALPLWKINQQLPISQPHENLRVPRY